MRHSYYLLLVLLVFVSCLDDVPDDFNNPKSSWNPSFSMAVGHCVLGMNDESGFNTSLLNDNDLSGFPDWLDEINIEMAYTMPFDLQEIVGFSEQIIRLMFRINVSNGFPADAHAQVYFMDINNQVVDSFFLNGPLSFDPATVNNQGEITNKNHTQNDIVFENNEINHLSDVRNILIQGEINNLSIDSTLIDYYPNYAFDVQMGLQVELNMSLSQNSTQTNF